ncbi:Ras family protein, partial [Cooperia oncophora]
RCIHQQQLRTLPYRLIWIRLLLRQTLKASKPSTVQESFAITPNVTNETKEPQKPAETHHKKHHKLPLAPTSSKCYDAKRTFKVAMLFKSSYTAKQHSTNRTISGDAGVGKTCLSFRFCCGRFPEHTEATIGVDFRERSCVIERELLKVQLWDTAGQERYRHSIVALLSQWSMTVCCLFTIYKPLILCLASLLD